VSATTTAVSRAVVVQHVAFEGPALIAAVLAEHGAEVRVVRVDRDEPLPRPDEFDVLVVMGGPMGAHDDGEHPHLADERALLAAAVAIDRPVLGICLGAQLLAAALGAPVFRGPHPEIGLGTVTLTPAGLADPVLGPAGPTVSVLHWHHDTFTLPPGAVHLASSAAYPLQAFRAGNCLGLQFHVELDGDALDRVAPHLPPHVRLDPRAAAAMTRTGRAVLTRWARQLTAG
jgi:GMP synthase (glutamine-hydrolysing)